MVKPNYSIARVALFERLIAAEGSRGERIRLLTEYSVE